MATTAGALPVGPPTRLWWSPTGRSWYPVSAEDLPNPENYEVEGPFADDRGLLAITAATRARAGTAAGAGLLWQVDLTSTEWPVGQFVPVEEGLTTTQPPCLRSALAGRRPLVVADDVRDQPWCPGSASLPPAPDRRVLNTMIRSPLRRGAIPRSRCLCTSGRIMLPCRQAKLLWRPGAPVPPPERLCAHQLIAESCPPRCLPAPVAWHSSVTARSHERNDRGPGELTADKTRSNNLTTRAEALFCRSTRLFDASPAYH
jgi:hypothetical protein